MASIYGLYDRNGNLRYIGKANDPAKRLSSHLRDMRRRNTPLYLWMRENGKPAMRLLERDCADWQQSEKRLIAHYRRLGCNLLNVAEGGNGASGFIESRAIPPQITEAREFFRRGLLALRNLGHPQDRLRASYTEFNECWKAALRQGSQDSFLDALSIKLESVRQ